MFEYQTIEASTIPTLLHLAEVQFGPIQYTTRQGVFLIIQFESGDRLHAVESESGWVIPYRRSSPMKCDHWIWKVVGMVRVCTRCGTKEYRG